MGKPLPLKTRRAIVRMAGRGEGAQAEIAQIFNIGERNVRRYLMIFRQGGDVDSHARFGGHMKPLLEKHASDIDALIKEEPDTTLEPLKKDHTHSYFLTKSVADEADEEYCLNPKIIFPILPP